MKFNIIYFGSSYFSAIFLEKLIRDEDLKKLIDLKSVVTQPDKPVGRKRILTPTPVKTTAEKYGLSVINSVEAGQIFDLGLVYAYGDIISKDLLSLPKYGFLNIHPSLLPKHRGTSPIATPLINGEKKTGVTIIKMDEKIDHGPVIDQKECEILPTDKRSDLEVKLTDLGFALFKSAIANLGKSPFAIKAVPQDHDKATYTKKLTKQDGFVSFENLKPTRPAGGLEIENSPEKLFNLFRGLYPWPGIWTVLADGRRLKTTDMEIRNKKIFIKTVQLEGKNEVDFGTFNKAYKVF